MKLKEYQERTLKEVKGFLEQLAVWRGKAWQGGEWLFDFAEKAWEKAGIGRTYLKKKDGLGRPLPVFCLKIPTGGGKTLLAVKTVDLVQSLYLKRQTGLVVWIVPTQQIYRQTMQRLKDRDDPYRQHLDMVSAGKTLILEKTGDDATGGADFAAAVCAADAHSSAGRELRLLFPTEGSAG
jgi:type III restriction enzyme